MKPLKDSEIGRLINLRTSVVSFLEQTTPQLERSFPATSRQLEKFSDAFNREYEENLLRVYGPGA